LQATVQKKLEDVQKIPNLILVSQTFNILKKT